MKAVVGGLDFRGCFISAICDPELYFLYYPNVGRMTMCPSFTADIIQLRNAFFFFFHVIEI